MAVRRQATIQIRDKGDFMTSSETAAPIDTTTAAAPAAAATPEAGKGPRGDDRRGGPGGAPGKGRDRGPRPPKTLSMRLDAEPFSSIPKLYELDKQIDAELKAAMQDFSPELSLGNIEDKSARPPVSPDGKKRGTVLSIRGQDVFIDVPGGRGQGIMSTLQFGDELPKIGDVVEISIEGFDGANGLLKLTKPGAAQIIQDWSGLKIGTIVEAFVTGSNRGGLSVAVNGIRGFLPVSQIDAFHVENPESFINQKIVCMIAEVNPHEKNLVVSRRMLLEAERRRLQEQFWIEIEEGQIKEGVVKNIKPFGAFVDLGGADGLIPMGELSWGRVENAESVLKSGQKVTVKVMRVDKETRKIGLSLRQTTENPFDKIAETIHMGSRVIGKVTRIMDFGAFVEIAPGVEGLIHVSELGNNRVRKVRDAVTEGQEVEVQVISMERETQRIGLSLKAIADAATKAEHASALEDAKVHAEAQKNRVRPADLKGGLSDGGKALLEQLAKKYK